ncbi:MAG: WD40 repeat domain-containing protein [Planctomycetota bacterium]
MPKKVPSLTVLVPFLIDTQAGAGDQELRIQSRYGPWSQVSDGASEYFFASVCGTKGIVFEMKTGRQLRVFDFLDSKFRQIEIHKQLVLVFSDMKLHCVSLPDSMEDIFEFPNTSKIIAATVDEKALIAIVANSQNEVFGISFKDPNKLILAFRVTLRLEDSNNRINGIQSLSDGRFCVSTMERSIHLFDRQGGEKASEAIDHEILDMCCPDAETVVVTGRRECSVLATSNLKKTANFSWQEFVRTAKEHLELAVQLKSSLRGSARTRAIVCFAHGRQDFSIFSDSGASVIGQVMADQGQVSRYSSTRNNRNGVYDLIARWNGSENDVSVAISGAGKCAISTNGSFSIIDLVTEKVVYFSDDELSGCLLKWLTSDKLLKISAYMQETWLVDGSTGHHLSVDRNSSSAYCIHYSAKHDALLAGFGDGSATMLELGTGRAKYLLKSDFRNAPVTDVHLHSGLAFNIEQGGLLHASTISGEKIGMMNAVIDGKPLMQLKQADSGLMTSASVFGDAHQRFMCMKNNARVVFKPDFDLREISLDDAICQMSNTLYKVWRVPESGIITHAVSPNGSFVAIGNLRGRIAVCDAKNKTYVWVHGIVASPITAATWTSEQQLLVGTARGSVYAVKYLDNAWSSEKLVNAKTVDAISDLEYSNELDYVAIARLSGKISLWDTNKLEPITSLVAPADTYDVSFLGPRQSLAIATSRNGVQFRNLGTGSLIASHLPIGSPGPGVISPDGFMSAILEDEKEARMFWQVSDAPTTPVNLEVFYRDFYFPDLLRTAMLGETPTLERSLLSLNRVQPPIAISRISVSDGEPNSDEVEVEIQVSGASAQYGSGKTVRIMSTGVFDLRLFREGQQVGQYPSDAIDAALPTIARTEEQRECWRSASRICEADGSKSVTFRVRLPHNRPAGSQIEFTAYAFNRDRIKSVTAKRSFKIPAH